MLLFLRPYLPDVESSTLILSLLKEIICTVIGSALVSCLLPYPENNGVTIAGI